MANPLGPFLRKIKKFRFLKLTILDNPLDQTIFSPSINQDINMEVLPISQMLLLES